MLSSVSRSAYICSRCRSRLSRNLLQKPHPIVRSPIFRNILSLPQPRTFISSTALRSDDDAPLSYEKELDLKHVRFSNDKSRPWEKAGLRPVVADTLLRAYPNAIRPTTVQKKMLTALTYGYSVAVRGLSGTGKSFAIAAWLLGLERSIREVPTGAGKRTRSEPTTSALVLVPNVDLAVQYYKTIINLLEQTDSDIIKSSPDSFVQLLYRRSNETELEQLVKLQQYPNPHIIIAPPTIILDILAEKDESVKGLLDVINLKVIVLEEIDAAITQLQYFSKLKPNKYTEPWRKKQVPTQILLDYIIKCRLADAVKKRVPPKQPQLVFPTATLSATQIKRFLLVWHSDWIHTPELQQPPQKFNGPLPGEEWRRKVRSNSLLSIEDPPLEDDKIVQFVPSHLHHHVVAYDIRSGNLRDAPLPKIEHIKKEGLVEDIDNVGKVQDSIDEWGVQKDSKKVTVYPERTTIAIIKKLLEQDNYPTNVVVAVSPEADIASLRESLRLEGIKARSLISLKWDDDRELGKLPVGRTDMLLSPSIREKILREGEGGDKNETTVWLTSFFFCRGLHLPGIRHLYILHRLSRAREYITYAGRVASWPYATLEDELKDPRSLGKDRRGTGKVVSVILEDNVSGNPDFEPEPMRFRLTGRVHNTKVESMVVTVDGSQKEWLAWADEAVRLAKLGCKAEPYFPVEGESQDMAVEGESSTGVSEEKEETNTESVKGSVQEEVAPVKVETPDFLMEALGLLGDAQESAPEPKVEEA